MRGSRGNSVGLATRLRIDDRGSIPAGVRDFLFSIASRPALGLTQPPIQCVPGALSPGVKRQECEADHSAPYTAEVTNGAMPSLPHTPPWQCFII
jgi:hypothetical protein